MSTDSQNSQMTGDKKTMLRQLPSVGRLLEEAATGSLFKTYGSDLTVDALRTVVAKARQEILESDSLNFEAGIISISALLSAAKMQLEMLVTSTLHPVVNATGVIIHTNLGRAPLSQDTIAAIQAAATAYSTLEYNLEAGERGSRSHHAAGQLQRLTGAQAAFVTNNTAAGVLLMLSALCRGKEVIISRGQLIEIGGGFRIPDVMVQSGARLIEVGTTNRTHLRDYATAISPETGGILVAHHSNFKIVGFSTEPSLKELADLAHEHNLPLLYDQGSGCLLDTEPYGLAHEPTVQEGLQDGCDVIAFSGDKLLGGPQSGVLAGRADLIELCRKHPLARAMRPDKLCLAGLGATLTHYLLGEETEKIPIWQMIARPAEEIERTAGDWAARLQDLGVAATPVSSRSAVGGGSLPGTTLPTTAVSISANNLEEFSARLRRHPPHVIGRIQGDRLLLDPRTVLPDQEELLLNAFRSALKD